jgi:hypothetical protein
MLEGLLLPCAGSAKLDLMDRVQMGELSCSHPYTVGPRSARDTDVRGIGRAIARLEPSVRLAPALGVVVVYLGSPQWCGCTTSHLWPYPSNVAINAFSREASQPASSTSSKQARLGHTGSKPTGGMVEGPPAPN